MRRLSIILLWLLLAVPLTAKNKALLIGVSDYPEGSGWCKLNAHNDVTLLREALGPGWDVTVLEDKNATHKGIVNAFKKVTRTIAVGDTVLVHFSGHGQQMLPIEEDPLHDPDMLDEAIIPFDAKKSWTPDYTGQNHIRDNEFGALIDGIRNKAGTDGLVVVVLDACHSDSMERGDDDSSISDGKVFRGAYDIFGQSVPDDLYRHRFKNDTSSIQINSNAHVVYISACQAHSRNQEIMTPSGERYGSLSYAVACSLDDNGLSCMPSFLDGIKSVMGNIVPGQRPIIRASFLYDKETISAPLYDDKEPIRAPTTTTVTLKTPKHNVVILILVTLIIICSAVLFVWKMKKY